MQGRNSVGPECLPYKEEVGGSNPPGPIRESMRYTELEAKPSNRHGLGVFARESISKGTLIANWGINAPTISESEYQRRQAEGDQLIIKTAVRWVGDTFLYCDEVADMDYINHSHDPNVLYHCGLLYANRDIESGTELMVDYRLFLAENDVGAFRDKITGEMVDGFPPRVALQRSCQGLLDLLASGS